MMQETVETLLGLCLAGFRPEPAYEKVEISWWDE